MTSSAPGKKPGSSLIPDTRVSGGATIEGQRFGFNVAHPSRQKCPDGYYWVNSHYKGTYPFGHEVAGHCRKAGSRDEMEEEILQANIKEKEQRQNFKMQKKEARFEEKQAREKEKIREERSL